MARCSSSHSALDEHADRVHELPWPARSSGDADDASVASELPSVPCCFCQAGSADTSRKTRACRLGDSALSSRMNRRQLFGLSRPEPKQEPGFSLDSFYRNRSIPSAFPVFEVHSSIVDIQTTSVGTSTEVTHGLLRTISPSSTLVGTPHVRPHACLAYRGSCSVCVEQCPVEGALLVEQGHPRVISEMCTRCGICVSVCPAPINGFEITPEESLDG